MSQETVAQNVSETNTDSPETHTAQPRLPRPAPRKKRWGDRKDGRRVRTAQPMAKMMPFIMKDRADAMNYFADELDVTETDVFCKKMIADGYEGFSFLHIMLAAYVRTISQKPALNRFISGQRIYARRNIEVNMTIKKDLREDSPDTCISVIFEPDDTVVDVYEKFNAAVLKEKEKEDLDSSFDKTADTLASLPRPILRAAIRLLFWLDYHGWIPKSLTDLSPFHGSMIITSMGSLGIRPIYHHIYNFGNLPVFISYGVKRTVYKPKRDGSVEQRRMMDLKVVTDERICDGFCYASAFKMIRRLVEHPAVLLDRPEQIFEDID
jgi:pyruvate/2-oxoglutarate dehydrogenase complex dihydrolipoamide acyltransferase (E2) component